jgi:hypothetical protein
MTSKTELDVEFFFKMASCRGVMLGVPDEQISFEEDKSNTWTTNKFGGVPVSNTIICRAEGCVNTHKNTESVGSLIVVTDIKFKAL